MGSCQSCGSAIAGDTRTCQSCGSPTPITENGSMFADESSGAMDGRSSSSYIGSNYIGSKTMDTNVAAAITYLAGFITGIVFLLLDPYKSNSFVRFHAFQSIFFNIAWVAFWIVWMIISAILTSLTAGAFGIFVVPLILIFMVTGFGIWAFLMYQAYQQNLFKLPLVGKFAAERAGVRL